MYKKKHNKIQKSLRSGAAAAQVYVLRLWYFNKLQFLDDQTEARESLSTLPCSLPSTLLSTPAEADEEQPEPSILEEVDAGVRMSSARRRVWKVSARRRPFPVPSVSQEEAVPAVSQEVGGPSVSQEVGGPSRSLTLSQVPPLCLTTKRPRKGTIMEEAALGLIREATDVLRSPPDAEEAYGCYLATRLMKLEEGQCLLCEGIFGEALQNGLRGQLTENSHVYELAHPPPPPPPATSPPPEPQPPRKSAGKDAGKHGGKAAGKTRK
ncbi:hypothetical protein AB205_0114510 [Aquarana catesbeiana]|uniref:Uncharacterized protein n=1 Tax=Aquarana catesbeiana TaxID=8400 RepID=A0A2G9Q9H6_AQUCT|nr:hypothetical protein AB205_0114510 [Aquarana catesbeiana]